MEKQYYEEFLKKAVGLWHPTARANRFVLGGVVELMLLKMLESCVRDREPKRRSHNQDSFDISFQDEVRWSVKSSFTPGKRFKLVNGLGGPGKKWDQPTVFFVPNFGIVYVSPSGRRPLETIEKGDGIVVTQRCVRDAVFKNGSNYIPFIVPNKKDVKPLRQEDHLEIRAYEDVKNALEPAA